VLSLVGGYLKKERDTPRDSQALPCYFLSKTLARTNKNDIRKPIERPREEHLTRGERYSESRTG